MGPAPKRRRPSDARTLEDYDLPAARERLKALRTEIKAGNGGAVALTMMRGLQREIAAAEAGLSPYKAARVKVPKVKMSGHFNRPDPEVDDTDAQVDPKTGRAGGEEREADGQLDIEAEVERRVRLRLAEHRARDRVTKKRGTVGKKGSPSRARLSASERMAVGCNAAHTW